MYRYTTAAAETPADRWSLVVASAEADSAKARAAARRAVVRHDIQVQEEAARFHANGGEHSKSRERREGWNPPRIT